MDTRSALRKAYEDGTLEDVRREVLARCVVDPELGCWLWQWPLNHAGYGQVVFNRTVKMPHRLVMGDPPGMVVHHVCTVRNCANPDHLQVVTPEENTAEMMLRNFYLRRIADLEAALAEVVPDHPLLVSPRGMLVSPPEVVHDA